VQSRYIQQKGRRVTVHNLAEFCLPGDVGLGISMISFGAGCAHLLLNGDICLDE
jgi:hypothetical protein